MLNNISKNHYDTEFSHSKFYFSPSTFSRKKITNQKFKYYNVFENMCWEGKSTIIKRKYSFRIWSFE